MTPEQWSLLFGALGIGGVLTKIVDVLSQGMKESRIAKDIHHLDEHARATSEAAFWSEKVQETRELYLREGGDPEKLGPPPRWSTQSGGLERGSSESK